MVEAVTQHIAPFAAEHGGDLLGMHLLGTSGTVTTLAGIHLNLARYNRALIDGCYLEFPAIRAVSQQLAAMTCEERTANPCIGPDRADLVLAGAAILQAVQELWPCSRVRVADRGLREGILLSLMSDRGRHRRRRRRAPRQMAAQ